MSYQPISLLKTLFKLFEKILLTRILSEVSGIELLRKDQFGLYTALQLAHLIERVSRYSDAKKLTGAFFPGCDQGLRYFIGRRSPLQANNLKFLLVSCQNHPFLSARKVLSVLPNSHIYLSLRAAWPGSGWNNYPHPIRSVRPHAFIFSPRRFGSIHRRHVYQSHVPPATAARQIPGDIPQ